ncbi:MAG: dephospho-CoA kinase, partial [Nitriliruptoraceae bacterium]
GSGKSTVAAEFGRLGAHVIDADQVARQVVQPGQPVLAVLAEAFGGDIVQESGELDRGLLAVRAFASDASRRKLDAITHPAIRERIDNCLDTLAQQAVQDRRRRLVVIDHPLMIEGGQLDQFDEIVVVLAPETLRRQRLVAARGMDPDDVDARMAQQTDDATRRRAASHVIDNAGDVDATLDRAHAVLATICQNHDVDYPHT